MDGQLEEDADLILVLVQELFDSIHRRFGTLLRQDTLRGCHGSVQCLRAQFIGIGGPFSLLQLHINKLGINLRRFLKWESYVNIRHVLVNYQVHLEY